MTGAKKSVSPKSTTGPNSVSTSFKSKSWEISTGKDTMTADPNIDHLHKLSQDYFDAEAESQRRRLTLDAHIQQMKQDGYSYPVLARESGLAQGTIQNIVAKST